MTPKIAYFPYFGRTPILERPGNDPFKHKYTSTVDRFLSKIRISELSTYFDEISFVHCFNITSEEEYQYSIEEILVDLLDDDCDLKVLILRKFNPEYLI